MKTNFDIALKYVLVHEGGWSDHPRDPGGATMKGVTLVTYQRYFGQDKTKNDLRDISDDQLKLIYQDGYWNKCCCDELPDGVDYAVFDAAVNSGPGRGAKWLQAAVGAKQDGAIGPKTIGRINEYEPVKIINLMCDCRLAFLRSLSTWSAFGNGWQRRVEGVRITAINVAGKDILVSGDEITPSVDYEVVKKDSTGLWVRKVQQALAIQVDGQFGSDTDTELRKWQKEHGLEPDGIAGRNTYRSLGLLA